jgi:hypothetical protein
VIEKLLISFTEVALGAIVFFIERGAVFHAATSTDSEVPAYEAFVAQVELGPREVPLFLAGR